MIPNIWSCLKWWSASQRYGPTSQKYLTVHLHSLRQLLKTISRILWSQSRSSLYSYTRNFWNINLVFQNPVSESHVSMLLTFEVLFSTLRKHKKHLGFLEWLIVTATSISTNVYIGPKAFSSVYWSLCSLFTWETKQHRKLIQI